MQVDIFPVHPCATVGQVFWHSSMKDRQLNCDTHPMRLLHKWEEATELGENLHRPGGETFKLHTEMPQDGNQTRNHIAYEPVTTPPTCHQVWGIERRWKRDLRPGRSFLLSHCRHSALNWTMNFKSAASGRRRLPSRTSKPVIVSRRSLLMRRGPRGDKRLLCARHGQSGRRRNSARVSRMLSPATERRSLARRVACRD